MTTAFQPLHPAGRAFVALVSGMTTAFVMAAGMTAAGNASRQFSAQLVTGEPVRNQPTLLDTMHAIITGNNPIASAMTSYSWWVAVIIGGFLLSILIFKVMRRFV